jgi:hypothetical protein
MMDTAAGQTSSGMTIGEMIPYALMTAPEPTTEPIKT